MKNQPRLFTLFGMRLADISPELRAAYDLSDSSGVLIMDPGALYQRLDIGTLEEGEYFWCIGDMNITNLREMVAELLRINGLKPPANGQWTQEGHRGQVRIVFSNAHGSTTTYINLTDEDAAELKRLAAVLQ